MIFIKCKERKRINSNEIYGEGNPIRKNTCKLTILLGVAVVDGLLALLAVGLALGGLVLDHGLHEVAEGGDPRDVGISVAVGVVGVGGGNDLEDDVGLLGEGLSVGGVGDDVLVVDVVGLDLEVDALLGVDGVVAGDLELLLLAVVLLELTGGGLAVLGDEIVVLHGLGHELGGGCCIYERGEKRRRKICVRVR